MSTDVPKLHIAFCCCGNPECAIPFAQMTPPDSGEREVRPVDLAEMRRFWSPAVAAGSETALEVMRLVAEAELGRRDGVTIPPDLAQRILAALEGKVTQEGYEESAAIAAELRERMGQKP